MGLALATNQDSIGTIPSKLADMPIDPQKKAIWFIQTFGHFIKAHINFLKRFKILPNIEQGFSLISISENDGIKVMYGKLIIQIPYGTEPHNQLDWINGFDIIIDNRPFAIDTGIKVVSKAIEKTSTSASRTIDKLLPPIPRMGTHCIPNKIIRIQPKTKK